MVWKKTVAIAPYLYEQFIGRNDCPKGLLTKEKEQYNRNKSMKRTGFVYDDRYLSHDTGQFHPESAERLRAIVSHLKVSGLFDKMTLIEPERAHQRWVEAVHNIRYIMRFDDA